jgi:transposase
MAGDEGRFGRIGEVRACWCPKGMRPIVSKQQVRQYVYAYAAVAPELGLMTCLTLPYANTKMMNLFLSQISQEFADYFVILQLDKASWHRSKSLKVPENIRLIFQPAHSPELMPVEHIWEEIREKHFYNQVFTTLNQVEDVLCQGLVELCSERDRLRSLTFFPHLRILPLNAT